MSRNIGSSSSLSVDLFPGRFKYTHLKRLVLSYNYFVYGPSKI